LECMACLLAAAVHDFEHLGVSNDFLVQGRDKRAMLYNDMHVNENHHVAAAFAVLARSECNFVDQLSSADWKRMRSTIIELVIATDMTNGGKIVKTFNDTFGVPSDGGCAAQQAPTSSMDAILLLQMAMKCADLGHLTLRWDLHQRWVCKLEEEFFAQGDLEKARGQAVSFLMDRSKPGCTKTQTGFFKFIVFPLFRSLVSVAPFAQPMLDGVTENFNAWASLEAGDSGHAKGQPAGVKSSADAVEESVQLERQPSKESAEGSEGSRKNSKRSGRARQRAAKWRAAVRRRTPSPDA